MKSRKIFQTTIENAYVFYSVFRTCSVFSGLKDGKLIPIYDFSGNAVRSTLNSLRNEGFDVPRFHFRAPFLNDPNVPTPYFSHFTCCYVYF